MLNEIKRNLENILGEEVIVKTVTRSDGNQKTGVTIKRDGAVVPIVYVEDLDEEGPYAIAQTIAALIRENTHEEKPDIDKAISRTFIAAVSNRNRIVNEVPHKSFYDIAFTLRADFGYGTAPITYEMLDSYGIDFDKLFAKAKINTAAKTACSPLGDFVLFRDPGDDGSVRVFLYENGESFGAGLLATPAAFSDMGCDAYLIPSSVHEIIAMPKSMVDNPDELKKIIEYVNVAVVPEGDVLSNSLFLYTREDNKIRRV